MVIVQRALLGLLGGFWFVVGMLAVAGTVDFGLSSGAPVLGVLMLGNGGALLLAAFLSARGKRIVDLATVLLLGVNGILSVTDDIGTLDIASLVLSIVLIGLVIGNMRRVAGAQG